MLSSVLTRYIYIHIILKKIYIYYTIFNIKYMSRYIVGIDQHRRKETSGGGVHNNT